MIAIGQITIAIVNDGSQGPQGPQGTSVTKVVREYTKSSSSSTLPSNPNWSETEPTIGANEYLWARDRTDLSNGSSTYGPAICSTNISGVKHDVDKANKSITDKVWESDITTKINQYDGSTVSTIRDRLSTTETDISGIKTRVSDVESETDDLGTRMTTAETAIDQTANNVVIKATESDTTAAQGGQHLIQSLINVAPSGVTISADKVNIEGATIFSSGRLSQTSLNNAYDTKGAAATVQTNLDNLEIGGRNLARNTGERTPDDTTQVEWVGFDIGELPITTNEVLTVSFDLKMVIGTAVTNGSPYLQVYNTNYKGKHGQWIGITNSASYPVFIPIGNYPVGTIIEKRCSCTITTPSAFVEGTMEHDWIEFYSNYSTENAITITNIKVEKGNKPTSWTPAPEDVEADITNAQTTANSANKTTVPVYYRSTTNLTPSISASTSIGTSNNTDNTWTYVMPLPKKNAYFYICEEYTSVSGTKTFSTVRKLDSQTYASKWVSSNDNTLIDGGSIYAHSITSSQLATDAIKSNNYQAAASGPYSATGTFLDLSNGNFYTPNFGVQSLTGKAYLNGEIIATSGSIGDDSGNYWSIGNTIDSQGNGSASIVGNGTAFIQDGDWQIHSGLSNYSNGSINTQWYVQPQGQGLQLTYPYYDGYYYDYGMTSPVLDTNADRFYNQTVSQNFLYIRKHASTIPALESDWNYIFRIDKDGMIWINGQSLTQMIQSGVDGGAYLPTSGGTVNGNVTITGTLTATASKANQLTHTLSINGKGFDGSGDVNVGTIGAAYGGTGQTSLINSANALLNALSTGSDIPKDNDYYISQYVNGGTSTTTYHRRPVSKIWDYIKSKLSADHSALDSYYVLKSGDTITGSLTVENGIYSDSAQLGDLIVTGAGRFANGLYGDLIGNADTATKAAKVADSGNGTETTFAYSKSGLTTTSWIAAWNNYELRAISPANLLTTIGADKSASISDRINVTSSGSYNWGSATNDDKLITSNTLAYWNGAYNSSSHASNIEYVKLGKLGALSIKDSLSASDVGAIAKSGDTMTGALITATNKYYESNNEYGINMSNSDLVGINGIYTMDKCDSFNEGIHFYRDSTHWDSLYARDGRLYFVPNREKNTAGNSKNVIIEGDNITESSLVWGDKSFTASYSVGDIYFNDYLRANRLAGVKASAISVEYSTDGGSTWNMYQTDDLSKRNLFTAGSAFYIGGSGSGTVTANSQLRITLDFYEGSIYTVLRKLMIYVSTNYSQNCQVTITASKGSSPDDYSLTICNNQSIAGWSGWNVIPCNFTTYGNTPSSQYQKIRFVFTNTGLSDSSKKGGLSIGRIYGYGGVGWTTPSTLALNGHVYSFDGNLNVTFPSNVTATSFTGNASSASKLNSTRSFTVGNTAKNVDWSGAVSFTKAEISDDASSTTNGWMSVADKKKLDSITVSDIGTIGANSIRGEKDIKVTISSGIATIGHENAAITAGTISGTATSTLSNGGSFKIPSITYDAYGHITGTAQTTITLPNITSVSGNAGTATKFSSARAISLSGDVSGSATADGSSGWSITTTASKLTNISLNSTTINNTSGTFAFSGSAEPWDGTDWVGFQVGSSNDKFQIHAKNPTTLEYRQNDSGGENSTDWGSWQELLSSGNYTTYTVTKTGSGASGTWGINITGSAGSATSSTNATNTKYLMNRGANTVTVSDSSWNHGQIPSGQTNRETVWKQRWTQSGITYTPSGGSATANTDSADLVYWLSSGNTSNILQVNMAIDGMIYALGGFKGNLSGNASTATTATNATNADNATTASKLLGFSSYSTSIGWGNQTGTPIMVMNDSTGGSVGFRRDNPNGGQTSMVIDGTVYIKEGQVSVGDAIKTITCSENTFTYTTLWGGTGTFTFSPSHYIATTPFTTSAGKVTELTTNPRGGLFSNGVAFTNPATRNDVGWIRMLGTGESDTIMEIATGDDGSEQIVARQYNTSNAIVHELKVLDASGNTSVPNDLKIGGHVTLSYSSTTESLDFIFN